MSLTITVCSVMMDIFYNVDHKSEQVCYIGLSVNKLNNNTAYLFMLHFVLFCFEFSSSSNFWNSPSTRWSASSLTSTTSTT